LTHALRVAEPRYGRLPGHGQAAAARDEADRAPGRALARQLSRISEATARFAPADSLAELVRQAPALLCEAGDFDRAMISRVRGSTWTPAAVHVAAGADDEVNVALSAALRTLQIPLTGSLIETEVLRHRTPMLVEPTAGGTTSAPHTFERLAELLGSSAYVVAPIVIGDRVAGFLHADDYASGRELTVADRAGIQIFAAMFGLLYERAAMDQRLRDQRQAVLTAITAVTQGDIGPDAARLVRAQARSVGHDRRGDVWQQPVQGGALTSREREILRLLASGATNGQIASALVVSDNTVKSHIKRILRKLPAANRAEAVYRYTQLAGQVGPGPVGPGPVSRVS
jgi:LuxR family transcriptional regulator, regulator of acetate metabolism